ncbi:MAG TPA: 2-C-methyl-D-erythritol 2,4-cyclodiphosphate synthase, partial [Flavisolibacter sp.]|nr:2-C-methyl-D-erythritol 2,4-cyclodiphosphate synthase [Flavisolibacter sp.]
VNLDSTLCLQEPKISPHIIEMRNCISEIIGTDVNSISIKATTTEKMGFVGRNEGLVAYATVLLESL